MPWRMSPQTSALPTAVTLPLVPTPTRMSALPLSSIDSRPIRPSNPTEPPVRGGSVLSSSPVVFAFGFFSIVSVDRRFVVGDLDPAADFADVPVATTQSRVFAAGRAGRADPVGVFAAADRAGRPAGTSRRFRRRRLRAPRSAPSFEARFRRQHDRVAVDPHAGDVRPGVGDGDRALGRGVAVRALLDVDRSPPPRRWRAPCRRSSRRAPPAAPCRARFAASSAQAAPDWSEESASSG